MTRSFTQGTSGISRRAFVGGALATVSALALAGCGKKQSEPAPSSGTGTDASTEVAAGEPVSGGTFNYFIVNPVCIEPFNVQEDNGMQVNRCLFDPLTAYDYATGQLVGKAATSWEANDDATRFTFHLREGVTFHNGDPVTSASFAYAWNRLCSPSTNPSSPSVVSYHLAQVGGYDDVAAGVDGAELDLECPDDYTLIVNLSTGFADFPFVASHQATSPVPEKASDDAAAFGRAPIGNGAFQIKGEWVDGQYIQLVRNENYWGAASHIDGVTFTIIRDVTTAYTEFEAGNLDFATIPTGRITSVSDQLGSSPDGYTANPGEQCLLGSELSVYYLTCNLADDVIGNAHVRKAVSYAINRQAICDTVFEGARTPADNAVPSGCVGYEEGAWQHLAYDVEKAKEELAEGLKELGKDEISIVLSCNSDGDHEAIMELIMADFDAIGIKSTIQTSEWAAYLSSLQSGDYQIGRWGWVADYPIMYNFLFPLFFTGNGDNVTGYSNPEVDEGITTSCTIVDNDERIAALQKVNALISEDLPLIPLMFTRHTYVTSNRVNAFYLNPMRLSDLGTCWLSA